MFKFLLISFLKDTMQQEQAHSFLTEHVWLALEEATVTLTLLVVVDLFSVHKEWLKFRREAPTAQIAKFLIFQFIIEY